ncbi:MAG: hypothetical protein ACFFCF_00445 [Promethearchaeota archaeon]
MELTAPQKERLSLYIRTAISILGGGLLITAAVFAFLVNLIYVVIFGLLVVLIGIIIGMYSTEIHYAIMSGLLAVFMGFLFLFGILSLAIAIYAAWNLLDILIMIAIDISVRLFMVQLLAIMPGVVVGRLLGPEWFEPIVKHKLKVGMDNNTLNEGD